VASVAGVPYLEGDARAAVDYRGGHLQIIASAGSGKTEVVSQRVAGLLASGEAPDSIVAFTFTERAASSLKTRIERCVVAEPRLGQAFLDKLGLMFVGTIHSYCFDLLTRYVPKYEMFDVLDEHRLTAFLTREAYTIGLPQLDPRNRLFAGIRAFLTNLEVIENELLEPDALEDPFRGMYETYLTTLLDNRFLTYGQLIAHAVKALSDPETYEDVHGPLRHLIVDEYQDVNPAQERLVERLAAAPVQLCVVGDDDQSIYQWRGSDVANIVEFEERYKPVRQFKIQRNRRSRPGIVRLANEISANIEKRLPKRMEEHRGSDGGAEVVVWSQTSPDDEARVIAEAVRRAHDEQGYDFSEIAILCRGRISLPPILAALDELRVPAQSAGRTNLFMHPEADLFGRTIAWLVGHKWRTGDTYDWKDEDVDLDDLVERYRALYELAPGRMTKLREQLDGWGARAVSEDRPANLTREFYDLLGVLGVSEWDLADPIQVNRLGTLARSSQLIADYEAARRRARPDYENPGELKGARDRGEKYYKWLAIYIQNWARGAYEGFEGEETLDVDAVDVTTIHQAKGLEWPLVFVPALSDRRFPSAMNGRKKDWRISTDLFDRTRYEGTENDERRLFYVATTRARDFLSLSTFNTLTKTAKPSRFLAEIGFDEPQPLERLPAPPPDETPGGADRAMEITFSELAQYYRCGKQYRLRTLIGFQPPLVAELGYGKAVHHMLRQVSEHVRRYGRKPTPKQLDRLFDDDFYLPAANKAGHRQMKNRGRELVDRYLDEWDHELQRVWEVERPFELHLGNAVVLGRADVILDESDGKERLTIVDYKTADGEGEHHQFQLQVYTDAGRREGLTVDRAFVHDMSKETSNRITVPVDESDVLRAEDLVRDLISGLSARVFEAKPDRERCSRCDVRAMCPERAG
jgi:DNA helicase-2/ATP-dependent DNA helicase PcrA